MPFLLNTMAQIYFHTHGIAPGVSLSSLMGRFHRRVRVGSVRNGAARIAFPPPKVGVTRNGPYWAVLVSQYSSVELLRRLKGCWQVRATHAVHWLVYRIALPCGRGIITNKHIIRKVFLDNGKALCIEENVGQKFAILPGRPTLLIFVHCVWSFFSLN
jgi:hypothetical protein